ncbi:hypothetical protein [Oryza sativa Japonica Group]|uniref:Uncharacterized protein n=1 Tax=Oryza sativa subsp. japonica TaxID=39947 RepID=Q656W3_ORYSJ|nr:hypothetical protein [Oryza sativa Japonica Group]
MKINTSSNVREGIEIRRRFHRRTAWSNKSEEVEALVDTDPLRRSVGSRRGELDRWMRSAGSDTRWRKAMGMMLHCKSGRFRPFLAPPPPQQQQQIAGVHDEMTTLTVTGLRCGAVAGGASPSGSGQRHAIRSRTENRFRAILPPPAATGAPAEVAMADGKCGGVLP